jgi:hypothetical protein
MHTFKKLPIHKPKIKIKNSIKKGDIIGYLSPFRIIDDLPAADVKVPSIWFLGLKNKN